MAAAFWMVIGRRSGRRAAARVADYIPEFATNGKDVDHRRAGAAAHLRLPVRTARAAEAVDPRGSRREVRAVAAELGAGLDLRVPPDVRALGARRDHRPGHRRGLLRPHPGADHRSDRAATRPGCAARRGRAASRRSSTSARRRRPTSSKRCSACASSRSPTRRPRCSSASTPPTCAPLGVPGGGGVMRAADLALFYQALLHNPGGSGTRHVLADGTGTVRNHLPDRWTGVPANRSLGLVLAGDDGLANLRGFGHTGSPRSFGHNGAGGQIAWADPDSGISFAYVTNGMDQHVIRQGRRGIALVELRGGLLTPPQAAPVLDSARRRSPGTFTVADSSSTSHGRRRRTRSARRRGPPRTTRSGSRTSIFVDARAGRPIRTGRSSTRPSFTGDDSSAIRRSTLRRTAQAHGLRRGTVVLPPAVRARPDHAVERGGLGGRP